MNFRIQQRLAGLIVGMILLMLCAGYLITPAEAMLVPQTITGTVEKGEPWEPLTTEMVLGPGDVIQTGMGSEVGLLSDDGSIIYIGEDTQFAVRELEYSATQQTRVSRFQLLWGTVTAKASTFAFTKNTFEIETDTVVAGFKFSSLTITRDGGGTVIEPLDGKFEFIQKSGKTLVKGKDAQGNDVEVELPPGADVTMALDQGAVVEFCTNVPLTLQIGGATVELGADSCITLGVQNGQVQITATKGSVSVNGVPLPIGQSMPAVPPPSIRALEEEGGPAPEGERTPQPPPAPPDVTIDVESPQERPTGSPVLP